MYEELGSSGLDSSRSSAAAVASVASAAAAASSVADYLNYQNYQPYPYGQVSQVQYVGSFTGGYGSSTHQLNPYDRYLPLIYLILYIIYRASLKMDISQVIIDISHYTMQLIGILLQLKYLYIVGPCIHTVPLEPLFHIQQSTCQ